MASINTKHVKEKGQYRLPPQQQKEKENEGRCRRLLCDIVKLRIFKYILKQPASFIFIVSLFLIAVTLPLLGVFIASKGELPDLDAMQNWNAYIGKLGQNDYCFTLNKTDTSWSSLQNHKTSTSVEHNGHNETVGVWLSFTVDQTKVATTRGLLYGTFSGSDVKTQIKDGPGGERLDDKIKLEIVINVSALLLEEHPKACDSSSKCTVEGCLLITALNSSVPSKLPQVHKNYTFADKVIESYRKPEICSIKANFSSLENSTRTNQFYLSSEKTCTHDVNVVRPTRGISKGHGLIYIKLRDEDKKMAAYHMYLAALAVAALGLTFAIGISLTDRPTDPKASQE